MSIRHISTLRIKHRALATTLAIATFLVIVATAACGSDSTERDAVDSSVLDCYDFRNRRRHH